MIKCILFDNDGTLVDSELLCFRAMAERFGLLGVYLDAHELEASYRGWKLDRTLVKLADKYGLQLPEDFVALYRARIAELFETDLHPVEGVPQMLAILPQVKAVVSSGPLAKIKQALAVTGLEKHFNDRLFSSYEVGTWKPDPGIYYHAVEQMGFPLLQCIAVEDSPTGLAAAVAAGLKTVFLNSFDDECSHAGVIEIKHMSELPGIINEL